MLARELAFRILSSPSVDEKFAYSNTRNSVSLGRDEDILEVELPLHPARTARLTPHPASRTKLKKSQLTGMNLGSAKDRAQLLHSFANHELLATELFAWAILRFKLPQAFEQGLVHIIQDEQRHFRLYESRIRELGFEFGDFPLNDFMWRTLTRCKTIEQFTAAMSLSFEQANLDFAAFYADAFARAGDHRTAGILKTVLEDEIQHVKHGLHWFEQWKPKESSLLDFHRESLVFPLTLARAQGSLFLKQPRMNAGFDQDYIQGLQTFSASKGRPPRVFYFNPEAERENIFKKASYSSSANTRLIQSDLSSLMMFLGGKDDVVVVPKRPSADFLRELQVRGFDVSDFFESDDLSRDQSRFRSAYKRVSTLEPWGQSPVADSVLGLFRDLGPDKEFTSSITVEGKGKRLAQELRENFPWPLDSMSQKIFLVDSLESLERKLGEIECHSSVASEWVAKAPLGNSGHHHVKFDSGKPVQAGIRGWMKNTLLQQGALIFEPWVDKLLDLSVLGVVDLENLKILGMTQFTTDSQGRYTGTSLEHPFYGLSSDLVRSFHLPFEDGSGHRSVVERLTENAKWIGASLRERGYTGPFGVDSFIYRNHLESGVELRSIVEVNTRWTMGHVALYIKNKLKVSSEGKRNLRLHWTHLTRRALERKGYQSFLDFHHSMVQKFGDQYFATNDPKLAQICLTFVAPEN